MTEIDEEFEKVDAGASLTYPIQVGNVKKGGHIVIDGRPCKVVDISTSKTGKHGHAKANITAIDIFNGKKFEESQPTSHNIEAPNIVRLEFQLISIDSDDYCTLMDLKGNTRSDLRVPNETENDETVSQRMRDGLENGKDVVVCVLSAMGIEKIESVKEA